MSATAHITIPNPTLTGGQHFIVKYRLIGTSIWTNVSPNPTNSPFDITGLDAGDYEMSINISTAPDDAALMECFTISENCECPEIYNKAFAESSGIKTISFDLNFTGIDWPPCGIRVVLTGGSGSITTILIASPSDLTLLTPSPFVADQYEFSATVTENNYDVKIYIDCCTGDNGQDNLVLCDEFTLQISDPPVNCVPMVLETTTVLYDQSTDKYFLWIWLAAGTPCDAFDVAYVQHVFFGFTPDSGTAHITGFMSLPIAFSSGGYDYRIVKIEVHPTDDGFRPFKYSGSVDDCCGIQHNF